MHDPDSFFHHRDDNHPFFLPHARDFGNNPINRHAINADRVMPERLLDEISPLNRPPMNPNLATFNNPFPDRCHLFDNGNSEIGVLSPG